MRTRKTISGLGNSDTFVKTLGLKYNSNQDHFGFSSTDLSVEGLDITKRKVLSDSAKIFGLNSCVTIVVKIIFQRLWERFTGWDEPIPPAIQPSEISNIHIPSCYVPAVSKIVNRQLIGFSDASERAYCGAVYLSRDR